MAFIERPKVALSREQLLDLTKGRDADVFDRSIDNQVSRLRRKIEQDPKNPALYQDRVGRRLYVHLRGGGSLMRFFSNLRGQFVLVVARRVIVSNVAVLALVERGARRRNPRACACRACSIASAPSVRLARHACPRAQRPPGAQGDEHVLRPLPYPDDGAVDRRHDARGDASIADASARDATSSNGAGPVRCDVGRAETGSRRAQPSLSARVSNSPRRCPRDGWLVVRAPRPQAPFPHDICWRRALRSRC